ncbi:MAG: ABC-2 transporter permease [Bacteroidetes bacterium]|nr:ABC-2 transporter permease [Bacteroidota bacterium]
MKVLLLKDFLCQKRWIVLYGVYSLIFFLMFGLWEDTPDISFILVLSSIAIGFMVLVGSFKSDKNETPRFMLSLPVTRTEAVHEKFLLMLLGTAYGFAATFIISLIFRIPAIGLTEGTVDPIDFLRITSGMLVLSFLLPIYFKFGQLAVRYFLFAIMGLGVALQAVLLIAISVVKSDRNIIDFVLSWFTRLPVLNRNLVIFAIGLAIFIASYIASLLIYSRKDV